MNGRPLILTILDGWGYSAAVEGNAIALRHTHVVEVQTGCGFIEEEQS